MNTISQKASQIIQNHYQQMDFLIDSKVRISEISKRLNISQDVALVVASKILAAKNAEKVIGE